jgi:hypothetical protein
MPVVFDCPCGRSLSAAEAHVGRTVVCPHCQRSLTIPSVTGSVATPAPAPATRPAPAPPPAAPAGVGLLLGVVGGLLLLIAGGVVAALYWNRDKDEQPSSSTRSPFDDLDGFGPQAKVRQAAARAATNNRLHQIMIALHNYHDNYGRLPPTVIREQGMPPRSWRVDLLPYIEQQPLYNQWRMDLPYDSPENRALWDKMPRTYALPQQADGRRTYFQRFAEAGRPPVAWTMAAITNNKGTSNVIAVALGAEPVLWCEPRDLEYVRGPEGFPASRLLRVGRDDTVVAMYDGSVRSLRLTIRPQKLLAAIAPDGDEPVDLDRDD